MVDENLVRAVRLRRLLAPALALCLLPAAPCAQPTPANPAPVPARDFARKATYESAKISPNGEYLAVTTWTPEGQLALAVVDIKNLKVSAALKFVAGHHVAEYWWVGPDRVVASVAKAYGPLDQPRLTGELYAISANGSGKAYLFGYRGRESVSSRIGGSGVDYAHAQMIDPLPHDPRHAIIATFSWHNRDLLSFPMLYRLDVYNGVKQQIGHVPVYAPLDVAVDRAGEPRFAFGDDAKGIAHAYVMRGADWAEVKLGAAAAARFSGAALSRDGKAAYTVLSDPARSCLLEITIESAQAREIHCGPGLVDSAIQFAVDDSGEPIGVRKEAGEPTEFFQPDHPDAKLLRMLEEAFAKSRTRVTSWTLDGARLVVFVDNDRNPGDFYLFDRAKKKAEYLMSARNWIDPERMRPVKIVQYKARDGLLITGLLTLPAQPETRAPLVMLPHGGPFGIRDRWEWDAWPQFLASRGFAVLQPNFRGSGGFGAAFEMAGYRKSGTTMIDDITDGALWAVEQGYADRSRLCIFGGSWGGYAALMSVVREPDLYRCAVGFAGVYDFPSQLDESDVGDSLMGRNYIARAFGTDRKDLVAQSPITHVDQLKAAVLLVHGTADQRVPFSQAKRLRKALDHRKKPYEWLQFDGEEHGFYKDENNEAFLERIAEFFDEHIGAAKAAPP